MEPWPNTRTKDAGIPVKRKPQRSGWCVHLRAELGTSQGTTSRVADQLGYGVESVRAWVRQADIDDGVKAGVTTDDQTRMRELEQEVRELKRANEILKRAASFFGAELDRQHKM